MMMMSILLAGLSDQRYGNLIGFVWCLGLAAQKERMKTISMEFFCVKRRLGQFRDINGIIVKPINIHVKYRFWLNDKSMGNN